MSKELAMNSKAQKEYDLRLTSAEEAIRLIKNGDRIYTGTSSSVAYGIDETLAAHKDDFEDLTIMCAFLTKESPLINCGKRMRVKSHTSGQQKRALRLRI